MRRSPHLSNLVPDGSRFARTSVAEAIYAPGKTPREIAAAALELAAERRAARQERRWPILATRVSEEMAARVGEELRALAPGARLRHDVDSGLLELDPPRSRASLGEAVVVAAGTTDRGPAAEAAGVLSAYGARVTRLDDVGVAGLHRLLSPERMACLLRARVIVAVAGMEGALPTVVAGLVRAPVIAVPTSVGYGVAEGGRAALQAMLASCAPGVAVMNVDNGFGAAALAVKILRAGGAVHRPGRQA